MPTEKNTNRPSHRAYAVETFGEGKSHWTDIGAAWPHKDGKGFNVKLNLLPLTGEIVIRAKAEDDAPATAS